MHQLLVSAGNVGTMFYIMHGIAHIQSVFTLMIFRGKIRLGCCHSGIQIHEIQTAAAVHIVSQSIGPEYRKIISVVDGYTSGGHITEKLVSQTLPACKKCSNH